MFHQFLLNVLTFQCDAQHAISSRHGIAFLLLVIGVCEILHGHKRCAGEIVMRQWDVNDDS